MRPVVLQEQRRKDSGEILLVSYKCEEAESDTTRGRTTVVSYEYLVDELQPK